MKLIIGLGNPGAYYAHSRHNIGFMVLKALGKSYKARFKKEKGPSCLSAKVERLHPLILGLPLTFMNLSGTAVSSLLKKHKVNLHDFLVVCDDLDLEFGRIRIRPSGSSGGHKGLQSIIDCLGTNAFARLRLGINRPKEARDAAEYVLCRFTSREKKQLHEIIKGASNCAKVWIEDGIEKAMNSFNACKVNERE